MNHEEYLNHNITILRKMHEDAKTERKKQAILQLIEKMEKWRDE